MLHARLTSASRQRLVISLAALEMANCFDYTGVAERTTIKAAYTSATSS